MPTQDSLNRLYQLRAVLDRLMETDTTIYEAISRDVEEAIRLVDETIVELIDETTSPDHDETE